MDSSIVYADVVMVERMANGERIVVRAGAKDALDRLNHLIGREGQPAIAKKVGQVEAIFPARTVRIFGPDLRYLHIQLGL